ncbi:MAG: hypothetical protein U5N86_12435 [Planctomycetota bacterium]|nr:hypothetical protein [Planctomycetota bacterium]
MASEEIKRRILQALVSSGTAETTSRIASLGKLTEAQVVRNINTLIDDDYVVAASRCCYVITDKGRQELKD